MQETQHRLNYLLDVHLFSAEDLHLNSVVLLWPQNILPIFDLNDEVLCAFFSYFYLLLFYVLRIFCHVDVYCVRIYRHLSFTCTFHLTDTDSTEYIFISMSAPWESNP